MKDTFRTLIYVREDTLSESYGGPGGYNYYLKCGLDQIGFGDIYYLPKVESYYSKKKEGFKSKRKGSKIYFFLRTLKNILYYIKVILPFNNRASIDLNNYDIVHFHSTLDLYSCRNSLKKFNGKVLLTSHTPVMPYKEILQSNPMWAKVLFFYVFILLKRIDSKSFKKCDYLLFPCKEAEESYIEDDKKFEKKYGDKIRYLLTGCKKKECKPKEYIRTKYNLPNNKFIVTFVGRHQKIKGYDVLIDVANKINKSELKDTFLFAVGGNINPKIKPPKIDNWKELGFVNDSTDLINASSLFISANTSTYFDLSILQALSTGQIILTRNVGGNKFLKNELNIEGVFLFDNDEDIINILVELSKMSTEEINKLRMANLEAFDTYFNEIEFATNYVKLLKEI